MRQWNVNPKLLCRKHLLGESVESHMFIGSLKHNISLKGYIETGLVEVHNIIKRHDELAIEMVRRGYNHKSPLTYEKELPMAGKVDVEANLKELCRRCESCKRNIETQCLISTK